MTSSEFENLVAIVKDPSRSEDARTDAIHALTQFSPEEAIPVLIDLMSDDSLAVRWAAASAIRKFGHAMLVPLLRAIATRAADKNLYESAHRALVRFGDPKIEVILEPVLTELKRTPTSSTAGVEALKALKALQG